MAIFREKTPKRRTINKQVRHYSVHRENLMEDFNNRCGYCDDLDVFRRAHYEIDHFIPKNILKKEYPVQIEYKNKEQEYSNLVYACKSCNNAKGEKWPTNSINISVTGNIGFIDPCEFEYGKQFERNEKGEIIPKTELGEWIYNTLKLGKPEHSIIWHLDELNQTIIEIKKMIDNKSPEKKGEIEKKLFPVTLKFHEYYTKLMEY